MAPAIILIFCFKYIPMYGVQIAFRDYKIADGILGSKWIGLKQFERVFNLATFGRIVGNTFKTSFLSLLAGLPLPIILALFMNQLRFHKFKRVLQTVTYMPHFISVVVMVSMINVILSPTTGLLHSFCEFLGVETPYLMAETKAFLPIYIISGLWQHTGWDSIIYLAALSAVDPTLYEAAMVDGAGKLKRIFYIDIPSILPTIVIMLIMGCGSVLSVGFDKIFLMQNDMNTSVSEVLSTYIYKVGISSAQYSMSSAVGLFENVVNFTMLALVNWISRKLTESSLW